MGAERLLLVEDDATTREVLTLLLENEGWHVRDVDSGEAALNALREGGTPPEVILCDLHLPGLQGAALAGALRPLAPGAGLIAMSALEADSVNRAAYDAVLLKPLNPSDVRAAMTQRPGTVQAQGSESQNSRLASEGELSVIATGTFLKLEQQMGARAKDLYAFALADAGDRLRRMEESLADDDEESFRKEAHALKGSAGMIGAERLAALAATAETTQAGGSKGSLHETVRQMQLACNEIRLMLETLLPM